MSDNLIVLDGNSNFDDILSNNSIVIVDFFSEWCAPCQIFSKILEYFANENLDVFCVKVNVDHFTEFSNKYNINSLPTILGFKNKKLVSSNTGLISKSMLESLVSKLKSNYK